MQFEQDGDVITADSDGFITIYSVDADGAYFVRLEFEVRNFFATSDGRKLQLHFIYLFI